MEPIKVAVIGAGLIGRKHLEIVNSQAQCLLAAVCDAHPGAAATAEKYHVPFYQDFQTLLTRERLDGAIIAAPTNHHASIGIACAEQGVPVLVEKPIAGSVADAWKLIKAADQHNVQIVVGHHRRHNPLVQKARELVKGGLLGELIGVTAVFALLKPADYFEVIWRTQPGGGPILTNLIHDIDNLRFICGEIESVYALTSMKTRGFEVEDSASLTLRFENGALGSVFVSDVTPAPWAYELTSGENPAYPQTDQDCYHFLGTKGSLTFPSLTMWRYPQPGSAGWNHPLQQQTLKVEPVDALTAQLEHFCQVIRGEAKPLISGREGLKTLAATQAVIESAQRNIPVKPKSIITI